MQTITSPMELLELADGESVSFRAVKYESDTVTITPRHAPQGKTVRALRVWVHPDDKSSFPPYYDLTSSTLVAQLEPTLQRPDISTLRITLTARGFGPKKRYQVDVQRA